MTDKYVLFITKSGLNDFFSQVHRTISYCKKHNRILLLDMTSGSYNINFSDYFHIPIDECNIIYDTDKIKDILFTHNTLSVYPNHLDLNPIDFMNKNIKFEFKDKDNKRFRCYKNILLDLPDTVNEDIILHCGYYGGDGFLLFKQLGLTENLKSICNQKMKLLQNNYLCIQVRNTDYKCDYSTLYENHKEKIHSYDQIYICTDDESVITFFKSKNLNVYCFTTFPKIKTVLHYSSVPGDIKIQDVIVDIFIATNSREILSNSKGGFIQLLRNCFMNKECILDMLNELRKPL